ncbi:unnamed protein product, partial [Owenia fusiformis]
ASDVNIFVAMFSREMGTDLGCQIYKSGMYGRRYQWIYTMDTEDWLDVIKAKQCTPEEVQMAFDGSIYIGMDLLGSENATDTGMNSSEYNTMIQRKARLAYPNDTRSTSPWSPLSFDAMWTIALTLNNSITRLAERNRSLETFSYQDNVTSSVFFQEMRKLEFIGVTGPVMFTDRGER